MSMTLSLQMDTGDVEKFTTYLESMERRASRAELLPILKKAFAPVAEAERDNLANHTISGALASSLSARAGAGDWPGTMSVFSAPTATVKQLQTKWGKGRKQQQGWAAGLKGKGRRRIFYGNIVHHGHIMMVRAPGGGYEVSKTHPWVEGIPFATDAMAAEGDAQSEVAAQMILDHIVYGGM